jgi:hypothetical protein
MGVLASSRGRAAELVDDLLARAAAADVEFVQLVPTAQRLIYRVGSVWGDVVELTTSVGPEVAAEIAAEIATRDVSLDVELRRCRSGWIVTLRPLRKSPRTHVHAT